LPQIALGAAHGPRSPSHPARTKLAIYALIVSVLADQLIGLPRWMETLAYGVAGIAWVAPLKPLFLWMNTGRWRQK
jgi:hypothetical protein